MNIQQETSGKKGAFYVEENGERLAELQYFDSGDHQMTIYHTEVDERLRGQKVGNKLVDAAVKFARAESLSIVPQCPFARKVMESTPEYKDIIAG